MLNSMEFNDTNRNIYMYQIPLPGILNIATLLQISWISFREIPNIVFDYIVTSLCFLKCLLKFLLLVNLFVNTVQP